MNTLELKPNIVQKTHSERLLELAVPLKELLAQVSQFKAVHKLNTLMYHPKDPAKKYGWQEAKTGYRYSLFDSYGRTTFRFYDAESPNWKNCNRRDELEFYIEEKTIPAIIKGLAAREEQLRGYLKDKEPRSLKYDLSHMIERCFNDRYEFTERGVQAQQYALVKELREYAKQLENMTIEGRKTA